MTFLIHNSGCSRRYSVDWKEIISVAFYNEEKVVVQTDHGWLEKAEYGTYKDINPLVLDKLPIRKLKLNFAGSYAQKQIFYAKGKVTRKYWESSPGYILYIPFIPDDWSATFEYAEYGTYKGEFVRWIHKKDGYCISVYIRDIPIEDNIAFVKKVRELFELAVYNKHEISDRSIIQNRAKIIDLIKNFSGAV